ncbi:MAG: putative metal-binding motif-containing protein [Deltaproteobacteria bacterium]|nr:putative metal-binding motif-containing protein [Deltaproteobacteria bacterium]
MRGLLPSLVIAVLAPGCSCQGTGITGNPDAGSDTALESGTDSPCWDGDGDGHDDAACGGDDCDDTRDDVYPGAPEICLDGVDQDCDTLVDGPVVRMSPTHLDTLAEGLNSDIAWTGSEFIVVWDYGYPIYPDISLARVSARGERIGEIVQMTDYGGMDLDTHAPRVVWTGSEVGLTFSVGNFSPTEDLYEREVRFFRVSPLGEVVAAPPRLNDVDALAWVAMPSWTGTEFGVAWRDGRENPCTAMFCDTEIYFTRLDALGDEIGTETRISDSTWIVMSSKPLWTGSEFFIPWTEFDFSGDPPVVEWIPRGATISRLDATGARAADDVPSPFGGVVHVWTGSEVAMAWWENVSGNEEIFFGRVDPTGRAIGEPIRVTDAPHFSGRPIIEWTGSSFGVAWTDGRDSGCDTGGFDCNLDLYFTTLDPEGTKLWADVRVTVRENFASASSLEWSGSEFGVSWVEMGDDLIVSFDLIAFCE